MSIIGSELLLGAADEGGYQIKRSLRFNASDGTTLSRTPSVASDTRKFTVSFWAKYFGDNMDGFIDANGFSLGRGYVYLRNSGGNLSWQIYEPAGRNDIYILNKSGTNVLHRDGSAWYHIVSSIDLTQASASNVCKFYINGELFNTNYVQAGTAYVANSISAYNNTNIHSIGSYGSPSFDGYLAEFHSIDGQILDASYFGEFDSNNMWQPIKYTGSYGTNGYYLNFSDNSSTSALGTDSSGNGNNWTANNFSVTPGAGNDSLLDSPTNGTQTDTGAGGEVSGNYCTFNVNERYTGWNFSNGSLESTFVTSGTPATGRCRGTLSVGSGKWYWEVTCTSANCGIGVKAITYDIDENPGWISYFANGGSVYENGGIQTTYASASAGDVIGVALNKDSNQISWYKNNSLLGTYSFAGVQAQTSAVAPMFFTQFGNYVVNFGQRAFTYTAPSGYKCLCTANLSEPTISEGRTAMEPILYTGNSSTQIISGMAFSPDLVWLKQRNAVNPNYLFDTIRGATTFLRTDSTAIEGAAPQGLTAFNSDGFTLGTGINSSGSTYVSWSWDAGSTTVSNSNGSITSQVRANPSTGCSIVAYTGTGTTATVGHGLGAAPGLIIIKARNSAQNWAVYHAGLGATQLIKLNNNVGAVTSSIWNNTAPTSSVFTVTNNSEVNGNTITYIAYCFSPLEGFSSFGKAIGNGNINGSYVHTGFRPAFVLWKRSDSTSDWYLFDNERLGFNVSNRFLQPNSTGPEGTSDILDLCANGFKLRNNDSILNNSGGTYIYMAFAENPFKYARAR